MIKARLFLFCLQKVFQVLDIAMFEEMNIFDIPGDSVKDAWMAALVSRYVGYIDLGGHEAIGCFPYIRKRKQPHLPYF